VDGISSISCTLSGFDFSGVETSDSVTMVLFFFFLVQSSVLS
jgi:hypothetical protein